MNSSFPREKLKNCPFCGAEMWLINSPYHGRHFNIKHKDGCAIERLDGDLDLYYDDINEAIKAWNTRADESLTHTLAQALELARKYLESEGLSEKRRYAGAESSHPVYWAVEQVLLEYREQFPQKGGDSC